MRNWRRKRMSEMENNFRSFDENVEEKEAVVDPTSREDQENQQPYRYQEMQEYQYPISKAEFASLILPNNNNNKLPVDVRLYQAAVKGDWKDVKSVFETYPTAVRFAISAARDTALHIAADAKQTAFVEKLVQIMTFDDLAVRNKHNNTALCSAAASGNVRIAEVMVQKNWRLPYCRGHNNATPLLMALTNRHTKMVSYLFSVTYSWMLETYDDIRLLIAAISSEYYDIALKLLEDYPFLAIERSEDGQTALHVMARKLPSVIGSKSRLHSWEKCINFGVYRKALTKTLARQFVELLWKNVLSQLDQDEEDIFKFIKYPTSVLHDAARVGNVQFLTVLFSSYPDLVLKEDEDEDEKSIIHVAIENRQESVFDLIYEIVGLKNSITNHSVESNYDMLRLVGKLAAARHLNRVSGAALQMQREVLWFKEVENIVLSSHLMINCDVPILENPEPTGEDDQKLTPRELFNKEHKNLRKDGEDWIKNTANSCMLVATLIATVVFAAAFTVPGGNHGDTGTPIFRGNIWFAVFTISDAIALVLSITSIMIFLSILTSRYAEEDFSTSLPLKLLFGLASLFMSLVCMAVAFSATFFMLYDKGGIQVPVIVAAIAIVPICCFLRLEYKLWADIFCITLRSRFRFKLR